MTTDEKTPEKKTYAAGSWQETLDKSASLLDRSTKGRQRASKMLWDGAKVAIEEWLDHSDVDVYAEVLQANVQDALGGTSRKGDASKIKTVALAVKTKGLVLANHANLSKAYGEAVRLTKTVAAQGDEDNAADEAVQSIDAPKSASTAEAAAKILLAKGVDEAVRLLLDVLNGATPDLQNTPAHRSFLRAVAQEINGRATAEADAAKAKAETERAAKAKERAEAKAKADKEKAAAAKTKAAAKKTAAKKTTTKAKPKPAPAAVEDEPADEGTIEQDDSDIDDLLDGFEDEGTEEETEVEETPAPAATKPKPVRRGPVKR